MSLCTIIDQDANEAERVCSLERTLELRKLMLQRKPRLNCRNGAQVRIHSGPGCLLFIAHRILLSIQ